MPIRARRVPRRAALLLVSAVLLPFPGPAAAGGAPETSGVTAEISSQITSEVVDLPQALPRALPQAGGSQRLLYVAPAHPHGALVMLPGGAGILGIAADGHLAHGANFLVRTREAFARRGFAVVVPDSAGNLRGRRSTADHAAVVRALAAFAAARSGAPVFLVGTSQGAIAAVNGAARGEAGEIAGLVLSEAVSRLGGSRESVFDAHPEGVRVPVLIVANTDDACPVAPPADAPRIAASLSAAPDVRVAPLSGGETRGGDCSSRSPHGYLGMEDEVVALIAGWADAVIRAGSRPTR